MTDAKPQKEINTSEWENSQNWRDSSFLPVYISRRDSRILVPVRGRFPGRTLNFGQNATWFWLVTIIFALLGIIFISMTCRFFT